MSIPDDDKVALTGQQIADAGLDDWRKLLSGLHARFLTGDFERGTQFVTRIAAVADEANHHPDVDLRYPHVDIGLTSHDVGALTARDVRLARRISEIAADLGVAADPGAVSVIELALDTAAMEKVRPFWAAVLGMDADSGAPDEVVDGSGRLPAMWFQPTEAHDEPRQRFHLDVHVPHDQAEARIAAALEAGGRLVTDVPAPTFWILADAEGNKACVCTWQGRD